jgi:hypothetical protein
VPRVCVCRKENYLFYFWGEKVGFFWTKKSLAYFSICTIYKSRRALLYSCDGVVFIQFNSSQRNNNGDSTFVQKTEKDEKRFLFCIGWIGIDIYFRPGKE